MRIILRNYKTAISVILTLATITVYVHFNSLIKGFDYILLDKRQAPNNSTIYQHVAKEIPYLPIEDLINTQNQKRNFKASCAWYPSLHDIQIHNDYWQEFRNTNITYYIFGAYLDKRPSVVHDKPMVRILTMIHFISTNTADYPRTYCQFWYDEQSEPIIMLAKDLRLVWYYHWGHDPRDNHAHFVSCALPKNHRDWIPRSVSLVSQPCNNATNNVRVIYRPLKKDEVKQGFAVCVKGLDFPYIDMSNRLVEYVETLRALGAGKIIMYQLQVHPNTTKVLEYYERSGFLEYRPFSYSLKKSNLPEYRHLEKLLNRYPHTKNEVIAYNDCLYRNMYQYDYVTNLDIDEILLPLGDFSTWYDLVQYGETFKDTNCSQYASLCFRCIFFPRYPEKPRYSTKIPEYFYMLQHVQRVRDHVRHDWAAKCFHNTDRVITTHHHFPFDVTSDSCRNISFNADDAQLNHYREPNFKITVDEPVIDTSLWRYKDEIIERSMKVLEELKFFE